MHLGEIFNGDIKHNSIVFNQSSNRPAIPTSGAGIEWQQVTVSNNIVANNPEV